MQFEASQGNRVEITTLEGAGDVAGMSIFIGAPHLDPEAEIVIVVDGREVHQGAAEPRLSTMLLTIPRNDPELLFERRIDL